MERIARFYKVSFERFCADWSETFGEESEERIRAIYDEIRLPVRATAGSAGYDFHLPLPIVLQPGETIKIPTAVRAEICEGWVLQIYPRSSLGFKYRLQLNNTVGIIDSDYFYSDNEGHIFIKVINASREGKTVELQKGMSFPQGILLTYGITEDDDCETLRNGGFGSTDRLAER